MRALVLAAGAVVLAAGPASAVGASASGTFTTINVPGATATRAVGINKSGEIAGSYLDSAGAVHGFTDIGGTVTTIDVPGASGMGTFAYGVGVSDKGQIVGLYFNGTGEHGFEFRPAG